MYEIRAENNKKNSEQVQGSSTICDAFCVSLIAKISTMKIVGMDNDGTNFSISDIFIANCRAIR